MISSWPTLREDLFLEALSDAFFKIIKFPWIALIFSVLNMIDFFSEPPDWQRYAGRYHAWGYDRL